MKKSGIIWEGELCKLLRSGDPLTRESGRPGGPGGHGSAELLTRWCTRIRAQTVKKERATAHAHQCLVARG